MKVDLEGDPSDFWGSSPSPGALLCASSPDSEQVEEDNGLEDLPPLGGNLAKNIANFCNQGFNIDDDREPAPENIPTSEEQSIQDSGLKEGQNWGRDGIDCHSIVNSEREGHSSKNNFTPHGACFSKVILHFLPLTFFADTVLVNTNDSIMALGEPELVWVLAISIGVSSFAS